MAFSKIILNNTTLMDATTATAAAADITAPKTAMLADGVMTEGTGSGGGSYDYFDMSEPSGVLESTVTSIPQQVINGRTGITEISLPNLVEIPANGFRGCSSVEKIEVGDAAISSSFQNGFRDCGSLKGMVLKNAVFNRNPSRVIYIDCFRNCSSLAYLDMNVSGTGQGNVFNGCSSLTVIVLRKASAITSLGNTNDFTGTPFASNGSGGTLYVPSSLKSTYESATNWSVILGYTNNQIKTIEGSYYETHYADGTLIS